MGLRWWWRIRIAIPEECEVWRGAPPNLISTGTRVLQCKELPASFGPRH